MEVYEYENDNSPTDVLEKVKRNASNVWPDDYEMQMCITKIQVAAWIDLNGY